MQSVSVKNVSAKLLKAIKQVGGKVTKTGWNSYSKYHYITESDINAAVLPALLDNGLILTTSVDHVVETPAGEDNKNRFATVHLTHTLVDTESGESLTFKSAGTGADTLDKSIYKALTGACKYMLMKTFMISGDDSDPENDGMAKSSKPVQTPAKPAGQGLLAKKTTAPTPVATKPVVKTEASKPSFGTKKPAPQPEPEEVVEVETETEDDPGF